MQRIAIMQGRLLPPEGGSIQSFPRDRWREEFALCRQAGIDAIEWIYDAHGADVNPLASDEGILQMNGLCQRHAVNVFSVCADYFMDEPLVRASPGETASRVDKLHWLLDRCRRSAITRVVLPFVDQSRIQSDDDVTRIVEIVADVVMQAESDGVELHLETSLSPASFVAVLDRLPHPNIKVNYDSGNSAALGYLPREEFAAYGDRIGSVHIKDRVRNGGTVPLGQGDADLRAVFDGLSHIGYGGDYVLQVARGEPGSEVAWASRNLVFVVEQLKQSSVTIGDGSR